MLFVLVICKPPYVLWFTILKHEDSIVNFFYLAGLQFALLFA